MEILGEMGQFDLDIFGIGGILKLLFLVVIVGYVIYVLLLTLRVRILADTVKTPTNETARMLSYLHLFLAVIGSFLAVVLILLG